MTNRQAKNSMLCPNCRRLISRDEQTCPYCGMRNPGSWWKNNRFTMGLSDPGQFISIITYTTVGMYVLSLLLNPHRAGFAFSPFDFLSPSNESLLLLGATGTVPILQFHNWLSLVTANYLHGSLLHILFNMIALRQIGPLVVQEYGGYRMFVIYTLGGIIGFLVSFLTGVRLTIGASAAVCSLIGAALYYGKSRGGTYGQTIYSQVGGWAIGIFAFGLLVPGIDNWAHGGGMAAGAALGYLLGYRERKREKFAHKFLALCCAALTALALVRAVFSAVYYFYLS